MIFFKEETEKNKLEARPGFFCQFLTILQFAFIAWHAGKNLTHWSAQIAIWKMKIMFWWFSVFTPVDKLTVAPGVDVEGCNPGFKVVAFCEQTWSAQKIGKEITFLPSLLGPSFLRWLANITKWIDFSTCLVWLGRRNHWLWKWRRFLDFQTQRFANHHKSLWPFCHSSLTKAPSPLL